MAKKSKNKKKNSSKKYKKNQKNSINKKNLKKYSETISKIRKEVNKVVIGQTEIIDSFLRGLLCGSNVLIEGVPGTGKTLIVKALGKATGCKSNRIQFTVDLLPTDIVGITTYSPRKRTFETIKGPIFSNFILADEIDRSPPKTQSAMIEAMQEKQVTIGKKTWKIPEPFFVMATQNPLESEGVYTLPEAQLDRFLFKVIIGYPDEKGEREIMKRNVTIRSFDYFDINSVSSPKEIIEMQELTKKIYLDEKIEKYISKIVSLSRSKDFDNHQYVEWGASPRASIGMYIASKAEAFIQGRDYVIPEDVKKIVHEVLRHRIILNYKASVEKITSDQIIDKILKKAKIS